MSAFSYTSHPPNAGHTSDHYREKDKSSLSIVLDAPFLALKGTGPDVEPTTLSGHVVLFLTEAMALKELTLQFRGKARIPMPANESLINNSTSITYVVCNHDWSFLESFSSSKRHSHTLKAGKHYFPFSLSIGGSLPSSISTPALRGASVAYKLRAVAARPGFAYNLQCITPVAILRTFTPEALEYQQTLEIENTWPDKVMYAVMLPHKAWAAGDAMGAVLKFSPLAKGVRVVGVVSALYETTKIYARSGPLQEMRVVCSARHEIGVGGGAVEMEFAAGMLTGGVAAAAASASSAVGGSGNSGSPFYFANLIGHASAQDDHNHAGPSQRRQEEEEEGYMEHEEGFENHDVVTYIKLRLPFSSYPSCSPGGGSPASGSGHATPSTPTTPGFPSSSSSTLNHASSSASASSLYGHSGSSSMPSLLPNVLVTPSHTLDPVTVSHRVRWSIYIRNRDGHISELRCSLPVVILDGRLKAEARDASLLSRQMMARSCSIVPERGDEELWGLAGEGLNRGEGEDGHEGQRLQVGPDRELPSYNAHVRDRVANMFLPEAATVRVNNPLVGWVGAGLHGSRSPLPAPTSPAVLGEVEDPLASANDEYTTTTTRSAPGCSENTSRNSSYANMEVHAHVMSHLPHVPSSGTSTPLDWVNSELMLSLSDELIRRFGVGSGATGPSGVGGGDGTMTPAGVMTPPPPAPLQYVSPGPGSRAGSRRGSRAGSRAASPERSGGGDGHGHNRRHSGDEQRISRPGSPTSNASSYAAGPAAAGYIYEPLPSALVASISTGHVAHSSPSSPHHQDHGHGHGHGIRLGSFFKVTMKPFTALSLGHKHRHDDSREESPTGTGSGSHLDPEHPYSAPVHHSDYHGSYTDTSPAATMSTHLVHSTHAPLNTSESHSADQSPDHAESDQQGQRQRIPHRTMLSMSTSELPAMRREQQRHQSYPYPQSQAAERPVLTPLSGEALLHRALTEVPDYAIASRGFIGGVPPLTSTRGLPSYEEAVAHIHARGHGRSPLSEPTTTGAGTPNPNANSIVGPNSNSSSSRNNDNSLSTTQSEPDLVGRFARARLGAVATSQGEGQELGEEGTGILQRLESGDNLWNDGGEDNDDEDDDDDQIIQMRSSHTRPVPVA